MISNAMARPNGCWKAPALRLIVSPADGGRALALVDKSTNDNLIALGGALHDFIVPTGPRLLKSLAGGDFSFNRAYQAEWVAEGQDTSVRLTYRQYEKSAAGIHVQKTLRLSAPERVEASYSVSFVASAFSVPSGNADREAVLYFRAFCSHNPRGGRSYSILLGPSCPIRSFPIANCGNIATWPIGVTL